MIRPNWPRFCLLAVAMVLAQGGTTASAPQAHAAKPAAANAQIVNPADSLPGNSLYQLGSEWLTDTGAKLRLPELRGKARLLTLFFGNCESTCPMVLGNLKALEAAMPAGWQARGGIVMVTLDPRRDDAKALSAFRKKSSMSAEGWTLIRGAESDTRELAMALGVAYRAAPVNGGMEHNAVIAILDRDGRIKYRHEGTVAAKLLAEELLAAATAD